MSSFSLQQINKNRSDETLITVYKMQKSFPVTAFLHAIILIIINLILLYIGVIFIVLSLFNPILLMIVIGVQISYLKWLIKSIKNHRYKVFEKKVKKWL